MCRTGIVYTGNCCTGFGTHILHRSLADIPEKEPVQVIWSRHDQQGDAQGGIALIAAFLSKANLRAAVTRAMR